jgi:hypothetical protein
MIAVIHATVPSSHSRFVWGHFMKPFDVCFSVTSVSIKLLEVKTLGFSIYFVIARCI